MVIIIQNAKRAASSFFKSYPCDFYKGSRKISFVRLPKNFVKSKIPGTETKFIAVEKLVFFYYIYV